jgi:DNA-binding response OmpR family regulator
MAATVHATDDTIRVLFIEDDPAVAEMYKLKLELDGYQVNVVINDDQVLQEAARLRPDMIFIDLRLGSVAGVATLRRLRATEGTAHLPVIILSSWGAHEMEGRGFRADQLDYVVRADPAPGGLSWKVEDWAGVQPN